MTDRQRSWRRRRRRRLEKARTEDRHSTALLAWLEYRRATWPNTANRHVLVSRISALGTRPVSPDYLDKHQPHGISVEHIRRDRILQKTLAAGADPLHLALVFNIDHTNAMAYANAARNLAQQPSRPSTLTPPEINTRARRARRTGQLLRVTRHEQVAPPILNTARWRELCAGRTRPARGQHPAPYSSLPLPPALAVGRRTGRRPVELPVLDDIKPAPLPHAFALVGLLGLLGGKR